MLKGRLKGVGIAEQVDSLQVLKCKQQEEVIACFIQPMQPS